MTTKTADRRRPRGHETHPLSLGAMGILLVCLLLMAFGAGSALAAPSWSPPMNLVASIIDKHARAPQVAVDAKGDAVAVWEENTVLGEQFIEADVRPASTGVWGAPVAISTSEYPSDPQVAVDAGGEAVAVWTATNDHAVHYVVQAATGSAITGKWQTAVTVSPETQYASEPQIAVNATGQAVAAWRGRYPSELIEAAVEPVKGEWQTPLDVSGAAGAGEQILSPQVTIDSSGDAVAVWIDYNGSEHVESSTRPAGEAWLAPVTLSGTGQGTSPQVATDASGDVLATWTDYANETIQSVQGSAGSGTWQTPVDVGPNPENHGFPDLAVNARGAALVTWGYNRSSESIITRAALGSALTGEWQAPIDVIPSSEKRAGDIHVVLDPQGDALAIWRNEEGETVVQAAAMSSGTDSFSAPVSLSTTGEEVNEPQVAFGGAGIGVAVWEEGEEDSNTPDATIVQAAAYTGTVVVPVVPTVVSGSSSAVEQVSATVSGTVNPNGSEVTECYFEYGASTSYASKAPCAQTVGSGEARVAVSAALSGLTPSTTYYYRLVAKDSAGAGEGEQKTLTTLIGSSSEPPTGKEETSTTPSSSGATTSTATTTTGVPSTVQAALACSTAQVALIDVVPQGSHVLITGAARQVLAGQKVSIKLLGTGKVAASATVQADGSFSATAPLPPAKIRDTNKARYEASVGSDHSQALKLERRMYMTSAELSGSHVVLSGYVTGSFKKGTAVEILLRVTCSKEEIIAKVKLTGSGKFTATVPAASATASEIAVYRAHTTVLNGAHPATTYTLPTPPSS